VKISDKPINLVKIISATMVRDREMLGDRVTDWIAKHPRCELVEIEVAQSSDSSFHCISIVLFAHDPDAAARTIGTKK
jgi:hypothetical protein